MTDGLTDVSESLGLEPRDFRNLAITVGIMSLLFFGVVEGTLLDRLLTAVLGGLIAGVVFVVVTVVINQFKPDHW